MHDLKNWKNLLKTRIRWNSYFIKKERFENLAKLENIRWKLYNQTIKLGKRDNWNIRAVSRFGIIDKLNLLMEEIIYKDIWEKEKDNLKFSTYIHLIINDRHYWYTLYPMGCNCKKLVERLILPENIYLEEKLHV